MALPGSAFPPDALPDRARLSLLLSRLSSAAAPGLPPVLVRFAIKVAFAMRD